MRLLPAFKLFPCWVLLSLSACTRIVDANAIQCQSDNDCRSFPGSVCHPQNQVCIPNPNVDAPPADTGMDGSVAAFDTGMDRSVAAPDTGMDGSVAAPDTGMDGSVAAPDTAPICTGDKGCFSCTPMADVEFLGACTDATCVPFDNHSRLANLGADGFLKPLP